MTELPVHAQVVLAVLHAWGPTHGFALARELTPTGGVGKAWAVPRQQVYRALDQLEASDMAIAGIRQPGTRGPGRTPYEVTTPGTRAVEVWLDEPVVHLRDARTLMLAKLLIRDRLALAREPFIDSQLAIFTQLAEALRARHMTEPTDLVARWRAEMALGVREATRRLR